MAKVVGDDMNRRTQDVINSCDVVIEALKRTKAALPELMRRNRYSARDGYPSTSFPSGGGSGVKSSSVETTVLSKSPPDPVARAINDLLKTLAGMTQEAYDLDNRRRIALENPIGTYSPCVNCSRALPVSGEGRCDACYRYKRRTGQERPVDGSREAI